MVAIRNRNDRTEWWEQRIPCAPVVVFLSLLSFASVGCVGPQHQRIIHQAFAPRSFDQYLYLEVYGDAAEPQWREYLRDNLHNRLYSAAFSAHRFKGVHVDESASQQEGLRLRCEITSLNAPLRAEPGAVVVRGQVQVEVRIIQEPTGEVVGAATITGLSSGGSMFAGEGTPQEALNEAAQAIEQFVLSAE